jgi:hypothetical protein
VYRDYITSLIGWVMNVQQWVGWEMAEETEVLGCHFIHHKSYMAWPGVGSQRLAAWTVEGPKNEHEGKWGQKNPKEKNSICILQQWNNNAYSSLKVNRRFEETCVHLQGWKVSQARNEHEARSSSVYFQGTTWRYIPEDRTLRNYRSENLIPLNGIYVLVIVKAWIEFVSYFVHGFFGH